MNIITLNKKMRSQIGASNLIFDYSVTLFLIKLNFIILIVVGNQSTVAPFA